MQILIYMKSCFLENLENLFLIQIFSFLHLKRKKIKMKTQLHTHTPTKARILNELITFYNNYN